MAVEAANIQPEAAPQEAPPEAQQTPPAEHWTKKPFEGGSLGAAEKAAEMRGLGKELDQQAEAEAGKFGEETKSWWGRAKERLFKKKEGGGAETAPASVKGEAEILLEIEKADAVFKEFRKKAAEIMVSGDEAGLRMLERSLSKTYDELAPQVAAEGAADAGAMKQALKTGEMPQTTETGAKLNYVAKRLADVRGKLNAVTGPEAALKGGKVVGVDVGTRQMRDGTTEGVVTTTYADGRERVETSSGRDLVGIPGGLAKGAEAPAEGSDENPILLTPEMRIASTEGVVSGETESKPEPSEPPQAESVVVSPEAHVSSALEKITKELDTFDFDEAKESLLLNFRIGAEVGKNTVDGWKKKRAESASEADFKKMLSEQYDIPADEIETIPAADLAAQHERVVSVFDRLIAVGEEEMKKAGTKTSEQASVASGEIENKTVLLKSRSSAESPTASGEIGGATELPIQKSGIIGETPAAEAAPAAPAMSVEPGPDIAVSPALKAEAAPETKAEAKEFPMDKLEASVASLAEEKLLPLAKAFESPKTYGTKVVMKMNAAEFLKLFTENGKLSAEDAAKLAEEFKTDSEGFNAARKKLANAINKLTRP